MNLLEQPDGPPAPEDPAPVITGGPATDITAGPFCLISSHEILASERNSPTAQPIACEGLVR